MSAMAGAAKLRKPHWLAAILRDLGTWALRLVAIDDTWSDLRLGPAPGSRVRLHNLEIAR